MNEIKANRIYLEKTTTGYKILNKFLMIMPELESHHPSYRRNSLTKTQKKIFEIDFEQQYNNSSYSSSFSDDFNSSHEKANKD